VKRQAKLEQQSITPHLIFYLEEDGYAALAHGN